MIVVSDTSPINYLVLARYERLLPQLFGRVVLPSAVLRELQHSRTPAVVREWAEHPPAWLEVRAPSVVDLSLSLGPGEAEAISLAGELHADAVLIDERKATRVAQQMGLVVTGTLGVLVTASQKGLLRLSDAIGALPPTFRASDSLLRDLLERAAKWERPE